MDTKSQIFIAIAVFIATVLVGLLCRLFPTKWAIYIAVPLGSVTGGTVSIIGLWLATPPDLVVGPSVLQDANPFQSTPLSYFLVSVVVFESLIGGFCAAMAASDALRNRLWKLSVGEYGWRGPRTAVEKQKWKSDYEAEQRKYLRFYFIFGMFLIVFACVFAYEPYSTRNFKSSQGKVLEINNTKMHAGFTSGQAINQVPVSIEYSVNGETYQFNESYSKHTVPLTNSTVSVIYDPQNPSHGKLDQRITLVLISFGVLLTGGYVLFWSIRQWRHGVTVKTQQHELRDGPCLKEIGTV